MVEHLEPEKIREPEQLNVANCTGCGVFLQTKNSKHTGYINPQGINPRPSPQSTSTLDESERAQLDNLESTGSIRSDGVDDNSEDLIA